MRGWQVLGYAAAGAIAGVAATWAMDRVTSAMQRRQRAEVTAREQLALGGRTTMGIAAEGASRALGRPLTPVQRERWASRLHWSTGAAAGATYGALFALHPDADWRRGLLYGAAVFVLLDEGVALAMGLGPRKFPWQSHARGAVGHLAYGLATHAGLKALQRPTARLVGALPRNGTPRPWSRGFDLRGALRG